jgi:leucyl aminopeptidase/proline iminopeptidase
VQQLAQQEGWQWQEFDEAALATLGAGAFLAVARGSANGQAAIVRLSYCPANRCAASRWWARGSVTTPVATT